MRRTRDRSHWDDDRLRSRLAPIVARNDGVMPSDARLRREDPDLRNAVNREGGCVVLADRLGIPGHGRASWNEATVRATYLGVALDLGRLPSTGDMQEAGQAGARTWAYREIGDQAAVAAWLGVPCEPRADWTRAAIIAIVGERCRAAGRMVTERELAAAGLAGTHRAIARVFGSYAALADSLGYPAHVAGDHRHPQGPGRADSCPPSMAP